MINTSALINELAPHQNKKKYINIDDNITRVSKQMHLKMSFGETGVRTVIAFEGKLGGMNLRMPNLNGSFRGIRRF